MAYEELRVELLALSTSISEKQDTYISDCIYSIVFIDVPFISCS